MENTDIKRECPLCGNYLSKDKFSKSELWFRRGLLICPDCVEEEEQKKEQMRLSLYEF